MKYEAKKKRKEYKGKNGRQEKETRKTETQRPCFPKVTNFNTIYLEDITSSSL
jgi:hypothetical protein